MYTCMNKHWKCGIIHDTLFKAAVCCRDHCIENPEDEGTHMVHSDGSLLSQAEVDAVVMMLMSYPEVTPLEETPWYKSYIERYPEAPLT